MENRSYALMAGAFMLALATALVWGGIWLKREPPQTSLPYMVTTTSSVTGLKVDAPVRYRGVEVGKVDAIRFDQTEPGRILISISVAEDTPISKRTYAQLGLQGVTGLSYVQLNDERGDAPGAREPLPTSADEVARLPLRPSLIDSSEDIVAALGEALGRVNALLSEENRRSVTKTLAGLEKAVERAGATAERASALAERASALADSFKPTARAVPALIEDARSTVKRAETLIVNLDALTKKIDDRVAFMNEIEAGASEVRSTVRAVNDDTVPRLNALADDLRRETRALDRLLGTLNDSPSSGVFGAPTRSPGPGEPGFSSGAK